MSRNAMEPLSALDVVTYGYKGVLARIGPLSMLCLPVLLLYGLSEAFGFWFQFGNQDTGATLVTGALYLISAIFSTLGIVYLNYSIGLYIRDLFFEESTNPNLFSYLVPRMSLIGVIGIGLMTGAIGIGVAILGVLGLLLFVVPGVMVFSFYYVWSSLIYVAFLAKPEQGVFNAISEVGALLKGNFLRAVGVGLMACVIYVMLYSPFLVVEVAVEFFREQPPSFFSEPWALVVYTLLMAGSGWVSLVIGSGGLIFILNRFYVDLHARHDGGEAIVMQGYHKPEGVIRNS